MRLLCTVRNVVVVLYVVLTGVSRTLLSPVSRYAGADTTLSSSQRAAQRAAAAAADKHAAWVAGNIAGAGLQRLVCWAEHQLHEGCTIDSDRLHPVRLTETVPAFGRQLVGEDRRGWQESMSLPFKR